MIFEAENNWELVAISKSIFCNNIDNIPESKKWYFVTKVVLTYCEKNYSSDQENLLKFEAEGQEFANFLRSQEQFIQTVKGQNNFW